MQMGKSEAPVVTGVSPGCAKSAADTAATTASHGPQIIGLTEHTLIVRMAAYPKPDDS